MEQMEYVLLQKHHQAPCGQQWLQVFRSMLYKMRFWETWEIITTIAQLRVHTWNTRWCCIIMQSTFVPLNI